MSEKFGKCPHCKGLGYFFVKPPHEQEYEATCLRCDGTGNDADAITYYKKEVL